MNKQSLLIAVALLNIYAGAQAAAHELGLDFLGPKAQVKIAEINEKLNPLTVEELQAILAGNTARARRRSLSPEERSALHARNCEISKQFLDSRYILEQEIVEQLNAELVHNITQLNIHGIKPSEKGELALTNIVITQKLGKLGIEIDERLFESTVRKPQIATEREEVI